MAAVHASVLLVVLLVSFCKESLEAGGWTEDKTPNRPVNRALARYAYVKNKARTGSGERLTYLVTQARRKVVEGITFNLGFIVFSGDQMAEKCITAVVMPPPGSAQRGANVTKFWCRSSLSE
ncbi:hypothetical protein MTO96_034474 [Rhipicephalus appendiculatus]|uniref:Cystatin n=1 Tax=Rhipicephalus appendiculatus TaxID=34631 RepID=A0A131Z6P6_RHIAP